MTGETVSAESVVAGVRWVEGGMDGDRYGQCIVGSRLFLEIPAHPVVFTPSADSVCPAAPAVSRR